MKVVGWEARPSCLPEQELGIRVAAGLQGRKAEEEHPDKVVEEQETEPYRVPSE